MTSTRSLSAIALDVRMDWKRIYFGAVPYIDAMSVMGDIGDNYGQDSGELIVAYFLGNATTWKGERARAIKAELNAMLKKAYNRPSEVRPSSLDVYGR